MSYLTTCLHKVASLMYIHDALYQLNIPRTVKRLELRPFSMKTLRIPLRIFGMDYLSSTSNLHLLPRIFPLNMHLISSYGTFSLLAHLTTSFTLNHPQPQTLGTVLHPANNSSLPSALQIAPSHIPKRPATNPKRTILPHTQQPNRPRCLL